MSAIATRWCPPFPPAWPGAIAALANFGMLFGGSRDERPNPIAGHSGRHSRPAGRQPDPDGHPSRAREFGADAGGAEISGDPQALAMALQKIDHYARGLPMPTAEHHPETAQMMIINPLTGADMAQLFSTHPPLPSALPG